MIRRFTTLVVLAATGFSVAASPWPTRNQIDGWLANLGADGHYDAREGIDWGVMPGPFYTPELGLGLGAAIAGVYRPDDSGPATQNSTLTLSGYTSITGAFGLAVENYGFYADDRWRFFLSGKAANTPTYFWGQGFSAARHGYNRQQYTAREFRLTPQLMRRIAPATYLGFNWTASTLDARRIQNKNKHTLDNLPDGHAIFSSGPGLILSYDSRDFVPNPRKGIAATLGYSRFAPEVGSDTRYTLYTARGSWYYALDDRRVLAWEIDSAFTQGHVPWNELPSLGNSHRMRGYYEGRYRDKNILSTQLEYRQKLSWRHGVVGWLGTGTMSPKVSTLGNDRWLPNVGVGYRFAFKPGINVRLDYGIGQRTSGFYFQVGEAF